MKTIQSILSFFDKSREVTNSERIFEILIGIIAFMAIGKVFGFIQVSWLIIIVPLFVIIVILSIFIVSILYIANQLFDEGCRSGEWEDF